MVEERKGKCSKIKNQETQMTFKNHMQEPKKKKEEPI